MKLPDEVKRKACADRMPTVSETYEAIVRDCAKVLDDVVDATSIHALKALLKAAKREILSRYGLAAEQNAAAALRPEREEGGAVNSLAHDASAAAQDEKAWLIESVHARWGTGYFWAGFTKFCEWGTIDNAIRFCRKKDAERIIACLCAQKYRVKENYDACEHLWLQPAEPKATAPQAGTEPATKPEQSPEPASAAAHTDHPARHWDRTCPACNPDAAITAKPVAYVIQSLRDGSIGSDIAPVSYTMFNGLMKKLREHSWVKSGIATIIPLYPESAIAAARAEGVLEGMQEAAQLASESAFGQNACYVILAEIDRRKAEGKS